MSANATLSIFVTAKDGVSKTFGGMTRSVTGFARGAGNAVASVLKAFTSLRTFIAGFIIGKAFNAFQQMMDGPASRQFDTAWGQFRRTVGSVFADLADKLVPHFVSALDTIGDWIEDNRENIMAFFEAIGTVVKKLAEGISWMVTQIARAIAALAVLYEDAYSIYTMMKGETPERITTKAQHPGDILDAPVEQMPPAERRRRERRVMESETASGGWWSGLRRYSQQFSTTKTSSGDEVTPGKTSAAFDRANEAAVQFITTIETGLTNAIFSLATGAMKASQAIKEMAKAILDDLLKQSISSFVRMGLGALVGGVVPAAKGGVFPGFSSGFVPVKGYAQGGPIYSSPHMALIGEGKHREAVVPLPDGRSIPVAMSGGGGETTINHWYISATDTQSFTQAMAKAERQHGGVRRLSMNAAQTNRAFRGQFGIRR